MGYVIRIFLIQTLGSGVGGDPWIILGSFLDHSWIILGSFLDHVAQLYSQPYAHALCYCGLILCALPQVFFLWGG